MTILTLKQKDLSLASEKKHLMQYRIKTNSNGPMSLLHSYEDVFDLTETKKIALPIREDSNREVKVGRLTSTKISNVKEALHVLNKGLKNRTTKHISNML